MKKWIRIVMAATVLVALTSCGDATSDEHFVWPQSIDGQSPFYGETLTIATYDHVVSSLRQAAVRYMLENPGTTIDVIGHGNDFESAREEIGIQLMAGSASVLISDNFVDANNPLQMRFFEDWFLVMQADPHFDEADWFMNVFHAAAVNGQLHALPLQFMYSIYVANSTIPGLAEAFSELNGASHTDLLELHSRFSPDGQFYLSDRFDTAAAVFVNLDDYIDIEAGTVDFNNQEFIDFLVHVQSVIGSRRIGGYVMGDREAEANASNIYLFRRSPNFWYEYHGIFDEETIFVNPQP